jgi:dihydrofolate synthase/folylpolyglutamate synthase
MIHNYPEALTYLYANLPMFQRLGAVAYKADLTNTLILCESLDNPQHKFKSIHVAGTNGKGSTSHMLASVLQSNGYKTGLYTSPHLKEFTERIRVDGKEILQQFVVDFVNKIQPVIEKIKPSFFEITVAMAFDYFVHMQVDIAVIEVGLGGRLDSTNVITPEISVITNIGWDHKDLLGDTLQKIASEKAGIIKSRIPVIVSQRQEETAQVFVDKANEMHAPLQFASDTYKVETVLNEGSIQFSIIKDQQVNIKSLDLPLQGLYQKKNLPGVFATVDLLKQKNFSITQDALLYGLRNVTKQTGLKGRWQKLRDKPLMICDTGHNIDGISEVIHQIKLQKFKTLHIVFGMVKDKDITDVLALMPKSAKYYFCQANIPRAMEAEQLEEEARQFGLQGVIIKNVNAAKEQALQNADDEDFIFIGGSTFVVAEIDEL